MVKGLKICINYCTVNAYWKKMCYKKLILDKKLQISVMLKKLYFYVYGKQSSDKYH